MSAIPYTYPPPAPTISGDLETISRFLQAPTLVARRLRTILQQRFIGDVLLSSRVTPAGGAIVYEQNETIFTDRAVEAVSPGADYPITTLTSGPGQIAKVVKWGQDTFITDESINRMGFSPVDRGMLKLANTLIKQADSVCLSLIASSVTQTVAVGGAAWSAASGATILRDIMRARAQVSALNQGYAPDTLVVDDMTYANLASDATVMTAARRENPANPVYSGEFPMIAGLRVLPTPNLPTASTALILDSTMLGGIANEGLGGGYAPAGNGVESKSIRDDDNDQYRLRARRVFVPYVMEPNAAVRLTGV